MGILRFILALALIPLAVALAWSFPVLFRMASVSSAGVFSPVLTAFGCGLIAFLILWFVCPYKPVRTYVLGHELTHAVCGLLFGAKVSNLRVAASGGSVMLTKSNVLITLSPYCVPFYTLIVMAVATIVRVWQGSLPCPAAWTFLLGFTWSFHLCFTLQTLMQRQPDILEYGRLFSWIFIWCANVLIVFAGLLAVTDIRTPDMLRIVAGNIAQTYGGIVRFIRMWL